jgi:hypothetical protein
VQVRPDIERSLCLLANIRSLRNCTETLRVTLNRRWKIPITRPLLATRAERSRRHVVKQFSDPCHVIRLVDELAEVRLNRRCVCQLLLILFRKPGVHGNNLTEAIVAATILPLIHVKNTTLSAL